MGNEIKSQVDAEKNIGDEVVDRETDRGLMQFDVGHRNYGVIVGKLGYIVTNNEFCYQVRSLSENIELQSNNAWLADYESEVLTLAEIRAKATPIASYREWAHYWGIKDRIRRNYEDMALYARKLGADIGPLPEWGEEPSSTETAKRPISDRGNPGQAS